MHSRVPLFFCKESFSQVFSQVKNLYISQNYCTFAANFKERNTIMTKTKLRIWVNSLIGIILGLFGISCSSCVMYGVPTGDLAFKCNVSNEANEPLKGMQVVRRGGWKDDAGTMYWKHWADTLYTDEEGNVYQLRKGEHPLTLHKVIVNDTTGEYQSDSTITEVKYKGGDLSWYEGKATLETNFTLHKKGK